jgi:EAL domain-containing protein (putative c-di-GMP-specific phosphodiesterase class I)
VGQLEALRTIAGLVGVRIAEERAAAADRAARAAALLSTVDGPGPTIVLQPIVGLRSGTVVGFEALSRFGERPPADVFAEARELEVGVALELAAARAALEVLPRLPLGTYLSINLSPQAVIDTRVVAMLTGAVDAGLGRRLVVELTEHEQVEDYDVLLAALSDVRSGGVRLAVDDTGSGFASLQHVTRLRPDVLKLDMAFVRDVHRDPARRAVARALLAFARDLGAVLVAEGVEQAAELGELLRLGALVGQGFHLGRPAPADEVLARLAPDSAGAERFVLT